MALPLIMVVISVAKVICHKGVKPSILIFG
jgi:hypothetical protein